MADPTLKEDDKNEYIVVEDPKKLSAAPEDEDDLDPDHPDEGGDERIAHTSDDDREAIRERRRLEKIERKQRRDVAITRDKTELDFLRKQNDLLERRMAEQEHRAKVADINSFAAQAQDAQHQAEQAERVIAKAVAAGNGEDVTQAMRYRDQALARAAQLTAAAQQAQARPATAPVANPNEAIMAKKAAEFIEKNKAWYDPQGRDEDSAIVLAIDQALMKDGYAPHTDEYWAELDKRAARRLPEHFKQTTKRNDHDEESTERVARGGPSMGSSKEHAPASTRREVYISPERKAALMEAGVWDDPVLRQKYVKRYAEYDRINRA